MEKGSQNRFISTQLVEIFGEFITLDDIIDICIKHNWQAQNCIEDLVKYVKCSEHVDRISMQNILHEIEELSKHSATTTRNNIVDNAEEFEEISIPDQSRSLGAIPKIINSKSVGISHVSQIGFQESDNSNLSDVPIKRRPVCSKKVEDVIKTIRMGYKIMIIMRGAPGCGKSYLARYIIDQTIGTNYRNYIMSTDDYFYNIHNQYVYKSEKLQEAHEHNQKRVKKKAAEGWSPVIVDNTNIKIWEMFPYVQTAVHNGYIIEILQPENDWCYTASELFRKNKHGVPYEYIQKMLRNFESITVADLLKMNNLKYSVQIPLYRRHPPLDDTLICKLNSSVINKVNTEILEEADVQTSVESKVQNDNTIKVARNTRFSANNNVFKKTSLSECEQLTKHLYDSILKVEENSANKIEISQHEYICDQTRHLTNETTDSTNSANIWIDYDEMSESCSEVLKKYDIKSQNAPKPARNIRKSHRIQNDTSLREILDNTLPGMNNSDWKSYEEESNEFWVTNQHNTVTLDRQMGQLQEMSNLFKPKRGSNELTKDSMNLSSLLQNETKNSNLTNNAENNTDEIKLERHKLGCPNESKSFLMLRQIYQNKQLDGLWDLFEKCNGDVNWAIDILLKDDSCIDQQILDTNVEDYSKCWCEDNRHELVKPNKDKKMSLPEKITRYKNKKKGLSSSVPEILEAKHAIEKQIVLAEEYCSNNLKQIRNFRHGIDVNDFSIFNASITTENSQDLIQDTDESGGENYVSDAECKDVIEINLGRELVQQLELVFNTYSSPKYSLSDFTTKVFMPKNVAKELYTLWMESLYNQIEEQKQSRIREDEELARFLQNLESCAKFLVPSKNLKDINIDLAWALYKSDKQNWRNSTPNDLASYLTRLKLYDLFPNVNKDTLLEILIAHDNRFSDTVEVLRDSLKENDDEIRQERTHLSNQAKNTAEKNIMRREDQTVQSRNVEPRYVEEKFDSEERKKLALKDFEESRNLAVHHSQLKAESYRKAKDAIQRCNYAVAVYYSQIANLHKSKIEKYNQKAASCIMDLQNLNQTNPDFIDLHYLHVIEAVECLDVFVDQHITKLKNICRSYKFVFIITGRGLHSTGGISAIKNKVKTRLKERSLTWSEVNPGLLKVKIFSTSKYSRNS